MTQDNGSKKPVNSASPVICLDGSSGVGKGTICMLVAKKLGWQILDSGSLYRLTALKAYQEKLFDQIEATDNVISDKLAERLSEIALNLAVKYRENSGDLEIYLDNKEVSPLIRTEQAGSRASIVAAVPAVREALLARQRAFSQPPGLVADGRDMGTVVFPKAPLKIFLMATAEERAQRRYKQLKEKGIDVNLSDLTDDLIARDERDMNRSVAPLKPAEDAIVVDTSKMDIETVFATVMHHYDECFT